MVNTIRSKKFYFYLKNNPIKIGKVIINPSVCKLLDKKERFCFIKNKTKGIDFHLTKHK